jgi:hypothetical protein
MTKSVSEPGVQSRLAALVHESRDCGGNDRGSKRAVCAAGPGVRL